MHPFCYGGHLKNITAVHARAEDYAIKNREKFDIVLEKNKSYDENKNKTNDINLPKKQRARIHDFIVYKNNFYVVEDKYENILICRCQNSKNKKHINYYADYKIVGADLTRKRS